VFADSTRLIGHNQVVLAVQLLVTLPVEHRLFNVENHDDAADNLIVGCPVRTRRKHRLPFC